jgi:serine/threonine protein kinase
MNQSGWERIQEIYHAALALPRAERNAFVANACARDSECLREVESLLEAADSSSGFLDTPVFRVSPMPDNLVGIKIADRYRLERQLGGGGMSQVYYALDENLHQPVVIKILAKELLQNPYVRKHFDQEVEALLRIDHPHVVRVLYRGELDDGRPYIVMPYVDGEMLRSQIPNQGMDLKRAASILKQTGEALEVVHAEKIVHRDLKPENIMLRQGTDSVVLIDFGIAKVHNSDIAPTTSTGPSIGTLPYMSPEQHQRQEVTAASDIYAMGVIAYEMVTGRRPFKGTSSAHYVELQRAGVRVMPMDLCEGLSSTAQDLILRALDFDPNARPQSAREFGDQLADALLTPEFRKDPRPVKRIVVSLVVIVSIAVLSFGIYWWLIKGEPPPPRNHQFTYWVTIQTMRDGKDYLDSFKSNDDATFNSGDKFRLNVSSIESGYLYVFNESPPEARNSSFAMLYPRKATNNGSASLGANQPIDFDWITFRGPAGAENFWIVWSTTPVDQLEAVKQEILDNPNAALTEPTLVTVREYLKAKQAETKVRPTRYKETNKVVVRSPADILVMLAQIKHR